jgi:hypothetical protein
MIFDAAIRENEMGDLLSGFIGACIVAAAGHQ